MRNFSGMLVAAFLAVAGSAAFAAGSVITVAAGSEHWMSASGPASQGVMNAVLVGNPAGTGFFVMRIKEPPNYRIPPHTHPQRQNITVLSGTYYLGMGTKFNKGSATAYPAGSFVSIPAHVAHYAFAGSSGAVLQEDGMGPSVNQMIKK
jgi:quercetin dioxygenase-like cupin family protein